MWIQGSTLSISQRTLLAERALSPIQRRAQDLARQFITSYSSRHATQDALDFIREQSQRKIIHDEGHLSLQEPRNFIWQLSLPQNYGVKGGAAREALVSALGLREVRQPRDIDIIRRGSHKHPFDESVAQQFMGRDYELGARVEVIRELDQYLTTRDLTINEVVAIQDSVHASLLCILDTIGHVIRPSRYRGGSLHRKPSLYGQSLLKMIRLYAEGVCSGENWSIAGIPEEVSFSEFDVAVHLNKAFQRGEAVANKFLHTCELLSLIPATEDRVKSALEELEHLRHGERGLLPDVPKELWSVIAPHQAD